MQTVLFIIGVVALVAIELLRWLADMPAETCTALTGIAWLCIAGMPAFQAVATRRSDQSGSASLNALVTLTLLGALALFGASSAGCGTTRYTAERRVDVEIETGPPCVVTTKADGKAVAEVTGPNRCILVGPSGDQLDSDRLVTP